MQPTAKSVSRKSAPRQVPPVLVATLIDVLIVIAAYTAAFSVRATMVPLDYLTSLPVVLLSAAGLVLALHIFGVYRRIWPRTSGHGVTVIVNAVGAVTLVMIPLYLATTENRAVPLSVMLLGNVLALGGFVAVRYRSRLISGLKWRWQAIWHTQFPTEYTRVLIIGAGESGQSLAWRLQHRAPSEKYRVVGFIDDDPHKQNMFVEGRKVLGDRTAIIDIAALNSVDLIVVAVHNISGPDFRDILSYCEQTRAVIKVLPDLFALVNDKRSTALLRDVQPEDLIGRNVVTRHEGVDLEPIYNRVVLITGAAGSIGSELSRQILLYTPRTLILLDNNESGLHDLVIDLRTRAPQTTIVPFLADVSLYEMVYPVFDRYEPQLVFHAAAYKHVPMLEYFPGEAVRVNVVGTRNIAQLASDFGAERFVLISTDKAVNPSSVMGASKRICELIMHFYASQPDSATLFASVRFGNVLGSRGSVVPTFNRQIDNGGPVTVTDPEMTRYFMSIAEAVNLIIHAAALTGGDDVFILKMGDVVRIVELAERMIRLRGLRPHEDIKIEFTGARPGEKLHEELINYGEAAVPTIHPDILHLNSSTNDLIDPARFQIELDKLIENPAAYESQALAKFFTALKLNNQPVYSQNSTLKS